MFAAFAGSREAPRALTAPRGWARFRQESSFIRHYLWKYRRWVGIGLLSLIVVDLLEVVPPLLLKESIDVSMAGGPRAKLLQFAAAYVAASLVQGICRYGWRMYWFAPACSRAGTCGAPTRTISSAFERASSTAARSGIS